MENNWIEEVKIYAIGFVGGVVLTALGCPLWLGFIVCLIGSPMLYLFLSERNKKEDEQEESVQPE